MIRLAFIAWACACVACSSSGTPTPERGDASVAGGLGGTSGQSGIGGAIGVAGSRTATGGGTATVGSGATLGSSGAGGAEVVFAGGAGGRLSTGGASQGDGGTAGNAGTAGNGASAGGSGTAGSGGANSTPQKRYGFTLDSVDALTDIVDSLRALPKRMLVRIVFDYPEQPATYTSAVRAIAPVADIVGQPSDSTYTSRMTTAEYGTRFEAYVTALPEIGIWEACNECNGDWGGPNTATQADAACDVIKAHGKSVLFTPYWNNRACADSNGDYLAWTRQKISTKVKQGADLVAVSIYGTDCTGGEPSYIEMNAMFDQLGEIFPNAQLGIGEYGSSNAADKQRVLRYFLDYSSPHPRYVFWGGYWYGRQDFVPRTRPLWSVFSAAVK